MKILGISLVLIAALIFILIQAKDLVPERGVVITKSDERQLENLPRRTPSGSSSRERRVAGMKSYSSVQLLDSWAAANLRFSGDQLAQAQLEIVNDALNRLAGMEMASFLDGLFREGYPAGIEHLLGAAVLKVFDGRNVHEARDWFASIPNHALQASLAYQVGLAFHGGDLETFLNQIPTTKGQQQLLTGYCVSRSFDPVHAFREYQRMLPHGGDYSGLRPLAAHVKSNFKEFAELLPNDDKPIAFDVRRTLIQNWAAVDPRQAAEYVLLNPDRVSPKQIGAVVSTWIETAPERASDWTLGLMDGEHRTEGIRALAEAWKASDPKRAWNIALELSDPQERANLLKRVHAEWMDLDAKAADAARVSAGY
jgi:hypothetical protein